MSGLFGEPLPIPLGAQIKEVERELAARRAVYPRLIQAKSMSPTAGVRQIEAMEAVLKTLRELQQRDRP